MNWTLIYLGAYGVVLWLVGYFLAFMANVKLARIIAWVLIIETVVFSSLITANESPLFRMLAIVSLQMISMKMIVVVEAYQGKMKLTFIQWSAFALGWFGMRPALFEKLVSPALPYLDLMIKGLTRIAAGFVFIYLSVVAAKYISIIAFSDLLLLVGLSLILHFGILNLTTALWRRLGVDVRELFRSPYKSTSLNEFWGKRWNIAFSEMTALVAFRPLKFRFGVTGAMLASFLLSGALHEIAISFPVRGGYGLPFCYFLIHGLVMIAESKSAFVKKITASKIASRVWVIGWLLVPMPLLFHAAFVAEVLRPLRAWF